jgi:hypothetical protein
MLLLKSGVKSRTKADTLVCDFLEVVVANYDASKLLTRRDAVPTSFIFLSASALWRSTW